MSSKKKFIIKSAKKGGKYVLPGVMMRTGAEVASHLINGPRPEVCQEGEYIVMND